MSPFFRSCLLSSCDFNITPKNTILVASYHCDELSILQCHSFCIFISLLLFSCKLYDAVLQLKRIALAFFSFSTTHSKTAKNTPAIKDKHLIKKKARLPRTVNQFFIIWGYCAEAGNEWRGPSPRPSALATQLRRNVAAVASRWRHCVRFDGPGIRTSGLPHL